MLGFLQWHVRPRVGAGPLLAGAYCHERWGNDRLPTPIRVLHSLVTVMTRCAEPWRPPSRHTFGIARAMFVDQMSVLEFFGPSIFVDAAWDGFGYRGGGGGHGGGCAPGPSGTGFLTSKRQSSRVWLGLSAGVSFRMAGGDHFYRQHSGKLPGGGPSG